MTLRRRLLVTSLVVCLPVAAVAYLALDWLRVRDQRDTLRRFVSATVNEGLRSQCEADPNWFLAGQRDRPTPQERAKADADVTLPRPSSDPLPFEFFAYDEQFAGSSSAAPRLPDELKRALRFVAPTAVTSFATPEGTGQQMAVATGWRGSPCAVLLFRLRPHAHQRLEQMAIFGLLLLGAVATSWLVAWETERRIRRVAIAVRESVEAGFVAPAPVTGRDEVGAAASAFNEAGAEIRRRGSEIKDRDEAMRRLVAAIREDVVQPLGALDAAEVVAAEARLRNLLAAATLRLSRDLPAGEPVDLAALAARVTGRYRAPARARGITLLLDVPSEAVTAIADPALAEQIIANLVDNAVRFGRAGGRVIVKVDAADGRFTLLVADDGPGASDETLATLTAVRRFRGDEAKQQQPGGIGLGLAIVREVSDRLGWGWTFQRTAGGGFEAAITGSGT